MWNMWLTNTTAPKKRIDDGKKGTKKITTVVYDINHEILSSKTLCRVELNDEIQHRDRLSIVSERPYNVADAYSHIVLI